VSREILKVIKRPSMRKGIVDKMISFMSFSLIYCSTETV